MLYYSVVCYMCVLPYKSFTSYISYTMLYDISTLCYTI